MRKFETLEDLAKAAGQLAGHFAKNTEFHKAAAGHHAGQATHHGEMSAFHKGMHDSLEDGHEHKALHKRLHEHHEAKKAHHDEMHKLHKAHGEDAEKAQKAINTAFGEEAAPAPTAKAAEGEGVKTPSGVADELVAGMAGQLKTLANDMITNDPATKEMLRAHLAEMLKTALGDKIVPDNVRAITPSNASDHIQLVPRAGQGATLEKAKVSAENEEMFDVG